MRLAKKIIITALALVFLGSGGMLAYQALQYRAAEKVYEEAESLIDLPELPAVSEEDLPDLIVDAAGEGDADENGGGSGEKTSGGKVYRSDPYAESLKNMDFSALKARNADTKGWIIIPNTRISYPLMQGHDNNYYLKHTYKKTASSGGAIFMDARNSAALTDFNTIIYGHRMQNGSMFESLKNYQSLAYFKKHPYIYVTTPSGSYQYTVFASYEENAAGESYRISFGGSRAQKQSFLDNAVGSSWIATGVTVTVDEQILTLSTCTQRGYAKRLVVHAKLTSGAPQTAEPAQQAPTPEEAQPIESPTAQQETPATPEEVSQPEAPPTEPLPPAPTEPQAQDEESQADTGQVVG